MPMVLQSDHTANTDMHANIHLDIKIIRNIH